MKFRIRSRVIPFLFILLSGFLMKQFMVYAVDFETNMSTNPVSASTLAVVQYSDPGDYLGSILINSRSTGQETIKVYDSSGTTNNLIGTINVSTSPFNVGGVATGNEYVYNIRLSSAITITKSAGGSDVTIIWKNVR